MAKMPEQLDFDFDARPEDEKTVSPTHELEAKESEDDVMRIGDLRRSVMAWLIKPNVSGLASMTPTRISKYRADLAACIQAIVSSH